MRRSARPYSMFLLPATTLAPQQRGPSVQRARMPISPSSGRMVWRGILTGIFVSGPAPNPPAWRQNLLQPARRWRFFFASPSCGIATSRESAATTLRTARRGAALEAEAPHVLQHRALAELLADLTEDRVDRVRERVREADRAEVLAAVVVQRHAADDDAVAPRDERVRLVEPGVERGGRGDDLHRRPGRVLGLRRAVEERAAMALVQILELLRH